MYIKLFKAIDDSQISEAPTIENAVVFTLRADLGEVGDWQKLYALAVEGYIISNSIIMPTSLNGTKSKWQLAPDDGGSLGTPEAYGDPLALGTIGDTDKVFFHVRAKATEDEAYSNDVTVTLVATGGAIAE